MLHRRPYKFALAMAAAASLCAWLSHPACAAAAVPKAQQPPRLSAPVSSYACEKYLLFVGPRDKAAEDFRPEDHDMIPWTAHYKSEIDKAFALVQKRAPGLVARACNGQRIPILLSCNQRAAMESNAARIMVFTDCFEDGRHEVAETLAHELTHLIDIGTGLSWSKQWNQLVVKPMDEYRRRFPNPDSLDNPRIERQAEEARKKLGFPTDYTAENQTEALAEYVAAIAISDFKAPPKIQQFIQDKILSMPPAPDRSLDCIRSGYKQQTRGEDEKAIASFTQALRFAPDSPVAHWFLGSVWEDKHEPELVLHELRTAASMLARNGVPDYSPDREAVTMQIRFMHRADKSEAAGK